VQKIEDRIREIKISELIPDDKNANLGTDRGRELLESSLSEYGAGRSILVDKNLRIIGGNKCIEQAENLNMDNVIVVQSDGSKIIAVQRTDLDLTKDKKARKLAYADNRIAQIDLQWNLPQIEMDFEAFNLGDWFSDVEMEELNSLQEQPQGEEKTGEELNSVPEVKKESISQLGDLFLIDNRHRVLCGDSTKKEDVERLMDGKKADMVFTDPPYGVDYAGKNEFLNKADEGNRIQTEIINDTESKDAFEIWGKCFELWKGILSDYHTIYICSPQTRDLMMMMMIERGGIYISNVIIWVKNNHVLGRLDYNLKHEPIIYGWLKSGHHKFYGNGEKKFSVWDYDKPVKNDLHPTMKPIALVVNAIENSSLKNMIVLDIFLGSGTTLIACEQTGRICYGIELCENYCDVIISRYIKLYPNCTIKHLNGDLTKEDFIRESDN
jgi:DNA modification methylase